MELTDIEKACIASLYLDRLEQSRQLDKYAHILSNLLTKGILYLDGLGKYKVNEDLIN